MYNDYQDLEKNTTNPSSNPNIQEDGTYAFKPNEQDILGALPPEADVPQPTTEEPAWELFQGAPPKPPKKERNQKAPGYFSLIIIALVCSLSGGLLGALGYHMLTPAQKSQDKPEPEITEITQDRVVDILQSNRENTSVQIHEVESGTLMTPAQVYAANVNCTVGITTSITTNYWGYQTTSAASGSGFIISADGYIITNHHVIEDSSAVTVALYDGTTYDAEVIGYDESNDIAILKVDADNLPTVILGNSGNMNVGDSVVAIGNPLGELTFSLTAGTVSALNREVTMSSGVTMNLIQTDCAINSGNSGGALFNLYGEVIGITNAKYSSSGAEASIDNIGFAIPISDVWNIIESIIEKGYFAKPYIGVSVSDVSAESQMYGLPAGAAVQEVTEDSPAEKAGLMKADIITHLDSVEVSGSSHLVEMVGNATVGQELKLTIYRKGTTMELTITVGEKVQSALPEKEEQQSSSSPFNPFNPYGR